MKFSVQNVASVKDSYVYSKELIEMMKLNKPRKCGVEKFTSGGEPEGMDPEGMDPEGMDPEGMDPEGMDPEGMDPEGMDPEGMDPEGMDPEGMDPEGMDPEGMDPEGMDPEGMDPEGMDPEGMDGESFEGGENFYEGPESFSSFAGVKDGFIKRRKNKRENFNHRAPTAAGGCVCPTSNNDEHVWIIIIAVLLGLWYANDRKWIDLSSVLK